MSAVIRAQPAVSFIVLNYKECASGGLTTLAGLTLSVIEQPALAGQHLGSTSASALQHCLACSVWAAGTAQHRCACPGGAWPWGQRAQRRGRTLPGVGLSSPGETMCC